MNLEAILHLLHELDDPTLKEGPVDFNYIDNCRLVEMFVEKLIEMEIEVAGVYLGINDSTHFAEAFLTAKSVFDSCLGSTLKFSVFGRLVFIECPTSNLREGVWERIVQTADSLAFSVIPFEVGEMPYVGPHPFTRWRERFFDYY